MNTNEQKARINLLLKRYDEAKTTDAEEVELAEFFRVATEVPEEWQDYAVLFSVLDSVDTLFIDEKSLPLLKEEHARVLPFKGGLWWAIGIAAAIILVAGFFLWSNNETDDVLPNRASVNLPLPTYDTMKYVTGPPMPVVSQEVTNQVAEERPLRNSKVFAPPSIPPLSGNRKPVGRLVVPHMALPLGGAGRGADVAIVEDTASTLHAEELLAEETSQSEQTDDSISPPVRFGALPTGSTTKGFGGGYVGGTYLRGLTMTHVDSMLIGRVAGVGNTTTGKKGKYITMRGYVTDEEKQPIANARIMVVGTSGSVYTDKNGFFEARLNNALRVQVVCEGYETKQDIKPKKKMKIKLKRINH